jgi:formylglycine-generating enzyme required for sulfatase activity
MWDSGALKMPAKYWLGALICLALTDGVAWSVENRAADKPIIGGMVPIPAGEFTMGSDKSEDDTKWRGANALNPYGFNDKLYVDEHPAHQVTLPAFLIDKYEVSNAQYRNFTAATGHKPPVMWPQNGYNLTNKFLASLPLPYLRQVASERFQLDMNVNAMTQKALLAALIKVQAERSKLPVTTVTWADADAYCRWAGKRLPTEAEWEKAARGPEGFEFPWGNEWDPKKINTMSENPEAPYSRGGSYPGDKSAYGVYDMAANVSEWVADWYDAYPGAPPSDNQYYGKIQRVTRGGITSSGHYDALSLMFRSAKRAHLPPDSALIDLGFRCAKDFK